MGARGGQGPNKIVYSIIHAKNVHENPRNAEIFQEFILLYFDVWDVRGIPFDKLWYKL